MELVAAYAGAFVIGIILGLMGGGGSILTVPLLVYIMIINPVTATAYSLFIVGTTSAFGSLQNYYNNNISVKTGILVALPSFFMVYITRRYIVPALPQNIIELDSLTISKEVFIMVLFGAIMLLAAISMLRRKSDPEDEGLKKINYIYVIPCVLLVGFLTGLVGSGGGFLIIPLLVFFAGLPMKKAVGTSLFIVAINSLSGFAGDIQNIQINWIFLLFFTAISVFGIFAGTYLQKFINGAQLKKAFGYFVLIMAIFILSKEVIGF